MTVWETVKIWRFPILNFVLYNLRAHVILHTRSYPLHHTLFLWKVYIIKSTLGQQNLESKTTFPSFAPFFFSTLLQPSSLLWYLRTSGQCPVSPGVCRARLWFVHFCRGNCWDPPARCLQWRRRGARGHLGWRRTSGWSSPTQTRPRSSSVCTSGGSGSQGDSGPAWSPPCRILNRRTLSAGAQLSSAVPGRGPPTSTQYLANW